ncbi:MAG: XkdX family protein [Clostridia bacterium]
MNKLLIKKYYRLGIYNDKHLETFLKAGYITQDDLMDIREG